jgi:hypothetical protein
MICTEDGYGEVRVPRSLVRGKLQNSIRLVMSRFAALENLEDNGDFNRAWDIVREKIKISVNESSSYYESKHHKSWFDDMFKIG